MNRRQFLLRSGAAALALGIPGATARRLARAAEASDRYYVFAYFEGGWDHLLGLDPRDPADFPDADAVTTGIEPGYDRLPADFPRQPVAAGPFTFGPAIGDLAGLTDRFSVVRGINMATLTHEVGRRYFITGRAPAGNIARGSSVASLATAGLGGDAPVPHLALAVESYAEADLPSYAAAMPVAQVSHLQFILRDALGIPTVVRPGVRDALAAYHARQPACDEGVGASRAAELYRANRERAAGLVTGELWQHFDFTRPELAPVRLHYGFTEQQVETPAARAALAAQALKVGLSRVVSVVLSAGLDTHDGGWATQHPVALRAGFDALARLLEDLRDTEAPGGGAFLDRTTLVAFSEFGRTARLNPRGGRDHLLTNCALLAGAGLRPSVLVGASSDRGMAPELVDLATGAPDPGGVSLKPEHVMTTVLHAAGLDAERLRSEPLPALLA